MEDNMAPTKKTTEDAPVMDVEPQTIITGSTPDIWSETALISIAPIGYGEITMEAAVDSIDMDDGENGVEYVPTLNGGRIAKHTPRTENTVTLEMYTLYGGQEGWPASTTTKAVDGVYDLFNGPQTTTTDPFTLSIISTTRAKIRLTILLTNSTAAATAIAVVGSGFIGFRKSYADGFITKIKQEYVASDGVLKTTLTAKFPVTDKTGASCFLVESTKGGAGTLPVLAAYSTTTKFR